MAIPPLNPASHQLLHGDFNSSNVRLTSTGVWVFDFDDAGLGPVEFDIANALYMVLLDSSTNDGSTASYDTFRGAFVAGYARTADRSVDDSFLNSLIDMRVRALDYWITHPGDAPIGIRTSSVEWMDGGLARLRRCSVAAQEIAETKRRIAGGRFLLAVR